MSYGPYSLDQMNRFIAEGICLPSDFLWNERIGRWIPILELFGSHVNPASSPRSRQSISPNPTAKSTPISPGYSGGSKEARGAQAQSTQRRLDRANLKEHPKSSRAAASADESRPATSSSAPSPLQRPLKFVGRMRWPILIAFVFGAVQHPHSIRTVWIVLVWCCLLSASSRLSRAGFFSVPVLLVCLPTFVVGGICADIVSPPTAICGDGTYSWSSHSQGTCSWHHGVDSWNPDPWWR